MRRVTVIVASPGSAAAIKDVLTDLSATGLVRDFFWLDNDAAAPVGGAAPVLRLHDGVAQPQRLADVLAGPTPVDHVTLCVLITTVTGDRATSAASERALSAYLDEHRRAAAQFTKLRVLIVRGGAELPDDAEPAFAGWHNVVIAPEDAHGPALGHESLDSDDPVVVARNATPVLVALCGLWSAVEHRPMADLHPLPGDTFRVARSFYRQLECGGIAEQLRHKLFDVADRLPLPYDQIDPVIYVNDVPQETRRMAEQLWTKHESLLKGPRAEPPPDSKRKLIGWREVLRMFLSFLWAALRNSPGSWQQRYSDERATATARLIERLVLGKESDYRVVVDGKSSDGRAVQWTAYAPAARQLANALDESADEPMGTIASSDLSVVWKDYASAAFTLCDAQERSDRLPPAQIGVNRAIIPAAADVIPGPESEFVVTPQALAHEAGISSVSPGDIAGINTLAERLDAIEADESLQAEAASATAELGSWRSGLHRSYGHVFGQRISQELDRTLAEVRYLLEKIREAAQAAKPTAATKRQRWLVFCTQVAILLFLLVLAADVAGVITERLTVVRALEIGGGAAIVLTLVLLLAFVLTERALFRLLNRLREAASTIDIDKHNLRTALRDVERLSQACTQYQSWTQILGTFLADPLGFTGTPTDHAARIRWGLPRKTAVGSARPDDRQVDEVAADLRANLFQVGWLSAPWDQIIGSVGEQLGPTARAIRMKPELILSQQGAGSGSALDIWADRFTGAGVPAAGSSSMWAAALRELGPGTARDRLIRDVQYFEQGVPQLVSVEHFRAGVGDAESAEDGHFDTELFTDPAVAGGKTRVTDESPIDFVDKDLGWIAVTTQFSDGVSFDELNLGGSATPSRSPLPEPTSPIF
ncbi:hypothetical protein ACQPW1_24540 [Nocardia sp. CA-128927]|uniref:hypothetical protein n=1 Tax=Nocardia sp. CA-128927 TaxID=3239975 RepID=UPI003D97572F